MRTESDAAAVDTTFGRYEPVWTRSWTKDDLPDLAAEAGLRRLGIRQSRLTHSDLAAVSAAVVSDRYLDGVISRAGDRGGVIIGLHWLSDDGTHAFLRQIASRAWSPTAVQDFAHMGGSALFHYVAHVLGIGGYSTCLLESTNWDQTTAVRRQIAMTGLLDVILTLRISPEEPLARQATNSARAHSLRPQIGSVAVEVHRRRAAGPDDGPH